MKKVFVIFLLVFIACNETTVSTPPQKYSPPSESGAFKKGKRQLEVQGYTNIKEISKPWFCCDDNDSMWFSTGFEATDKQGEKVIGCFCMKQGLSNSITIRFQ